MTQRNILEDLNVQQHHCENFRSPRMINLLIYGILVYLVAFSVTQIVWHQMIIIGKDVEASGHGLIWGTISSFLEVLEKSANETERR
jgi:hypothetical protein